ncbi:MAG TPA: methyl-accepting chemotaxis protein [Clostridia bacterium]|nr:methyl-accepting chemotaxis protein [Clostridia bacterium]
MSLEYNGDILNAFMLVAPLIKELKIADLMISVTDTEKFLMYCPSDTIDLKIAPGTLLPREDAIHNAMRTGRYCEVFVDEKTYGVPLKATAIPLKDSSEKIIGGVGIARSLEIEEKVREDILLLENAFKEINEIVKNISNEIVKFAADSDKIVDSASSTFNKVKKVDEVIGYVRMIADQTKMLGFNAAIEAARAGASGEGFKVVAKEIGKLSDSSKNAAQGIQKELNEMKVSVEDMRDSIFSQSSAIKEQVASVQQIYSMAEQVSESINNLNSVAQKL